MTINIKLKSKQVYQIRNFKIFNLKQVHANENINSALISIVNFTIN